MDTISETITENIFREFYGTNRFIEKSAIGTEYGFLSKNITGKRGYPDFFLDEDLVIIVEVKAIIHSKAEEEVKFYMKNNNIKKDIIGMAVSGQNLNQIKVTYFYKLKDSEEIKKINIKDKLVNIESLKKLFDKKKNGDMVTDEELITTLKELNETFNKGSKVRDTDRSLFFSGLMIALTNKDFRNMYEMIDAPSDEELATTKNKILESYKLNKAILEAISIQLSAKINNLSKEFSWKDRFSFIKNIDYSLKEYKKIISKIEKKIFIPYSHEEKQDILGKAYKIFLARAGSAENKNIILTPDHIKGLMIKLARLNVDDIVLDTCTGTGGFLMESMETLINLAKDDYEKIEKIKNNQLIGFENDEILFALACSNMFLHGDGRSNLLYRSSLLGDSTNIINSSDVELLKYIKSLKVTKCIINPPYEKNQSIKFVKQALEYLEPYGKLIIIMPTPTLYKNQNGLTEEILEIGKLDFVIKMPFNLFSEQKRIVNTSIFGFTKEPHRKDDKVLFYNLKNDGFVSVQHKGKVDKNNLWNDIENTILTSINNNQEIEGVCTRKTIFQGDEINCYGFEIDNNENLIPIGELFEFKKGSLASSENDEFGEFDFITADDTWKKHSEYTHDEEAIIYVTGAAGSLGKAHYANGKFIASNLCYVLTLKDNYKDKINLRFYAYYLNSIREDIFSNLADGTSKLTIDLRSLKKYKIELINKDLQDEIDKNQISNYEKLIKEINEKKLELNKKLKDII
ncbi:N-6 DNA methylase [Clostridium perfringens]